MKTNRSRTAILILTLTAAMLILCSCSHSLDCGTPAEYGDRISLRVARCSAETKENGATVFDTDFIVSNQGNSELTSVSYELDIMDRSETVLYTFAGTYIQNDGPVRNGETSEFSKGFQRVLDDTARKVQVRITSCTDQTELASKHIPKTGEYLYQAIENPYLNGIKDNPPSAAEIVIDHMGAQETSTIEDSAVLDEIVSAFTSVTIGEPSSEFVTDNYNSLYFSFPDGARAGINLNLKELELNLNGVYYGFKLDHFDRLWSLMNDLAEYER